MLLLRYGACSPLPPFPERFPTAPVVRQQAQALLRGCQAAAQAVHIDGANLKVAKEQRTVIQTEGKSKCISLASSKCCPL